MATSPAPAARQRPHRSPANPGGNSVSETTVRKLVGVFKMLADPSRLKILLALAKTDAMNVTSLKQLLEETQASVSQPAVSHHLSLLRATHLVRSDRQGKNCFYRIDAEELSGVLEQLFAEVGNANRQIQIDDLTLALKRR